MVALMQNPAVLSAMVGNHNVLFNLDDRQLHLLNATGAVAWECLAPTATPEGLAVQLAEAFCVDVLDVRSDLDSLLSSFRSTGLCHPVDAGAAIDRSIERPLPRSETSEQKVSLDRRSPRTLLGPFMALSVPVTVTVDDVSLAADLDRILDPLRGRLDDLEGVSAMVQIMIESPGLDDVGQSDGESPTWSIHVEGKRTQRFSSRDRLIRQVVAEVNGGPLQYLDDAVVFHSAAAEFDAGVVLFPGVSNAGKSTLITQLVHRGQKYVTDEAAMVRVGTRSVESFTKSITLEAEGQRVVGGLVSGLVPSATTVDVDPRLVGAGRLSAGGNVAAMIFPTYQENASTQLTELAPFDAFRSLLANAFTFDRVGQRAFDTIVDLANEVPAFRLQHDGDADHLEVIEATVALLGDV